MKKLTPFQKKMVRWFESLPNIVHVTILPSAILVVAGSGACLLMYCLIPVPEMGNRLILLIGACLLSLGLIIFVLYIDAAQWRWQSPERYRKDAQELLEEHSEFSGILNPLISESTASDDESGLAEKLGEINNFLSLKEKLISKKERITNLEEEILEIEEKISALEKELGL